MMIMVNSTNGNVFKPRCKNRKLFSMYDVSYVDRTLLTWHTTPISLMKQNMHILIMLHSNHCKFILTTLSTTTHQNTTTHALPLSHHSTWLGFCVLSIIKVLWHTGPIGWLANTYTSQNTLYKRDLMLTYCMLKKYIVNLNLNTEVTFEHGKKTLYYVPNCTYDYPKLSSSITFTLII